MLPSLSCILLTLHSGLNNLCFLYWKVIQNLFPFQLEPWCRQGLCGCTCHSLWGRWPEYTHWENKVLRLLDPGSHLHLYQRRNVFQPCCCQVCYLGCTEAQQVQSYSFVCEAYCSCQAYIGRWCGMPRQTSYEWQGHKVIFKKVDRIELLPDVLDDVHGKVRLVSIPN